MTRNKKGRSDCHQATSNTTSLKAYFTSFIHFMEAVIIRLALWGWLPMCTADWISNREGQRDD